MIEAIYIGVLAFVISNIWTADGMILSWVDTQAERLPVWLYKPIIGCSLCLSGQLSFWLFFRNEYDLINHFLFIGLSTITTWTIVKINSRI